MAFRGCGVADHVSSRRCWDVSEFGRTRFRGTVGVIMLFLVLPPLGGDDKVDGQNENEQSDANTGHNGSPMDRTESSTTEPLRWQVVD